MGESQNIFKIWDLDDCEELGIYSLQKIRWCFHRKICGQISQLSFSQIWVLLTVLFLDFFLVWLSQRLKFEFKKSSHCRDLKFLIISVLEWSVILRVSYNRNKKALRMNTVICRSWEMNIQKVLKAFFKFFGVNCS